MSCYKGDFDFIDNIEGGRLDPSSDAFDAFGLIIRIGVLLLEAVLQDHVVADGINSDV